MSLYTSALQIGKLIGR